MSRQRVQFMGDNAAAQAVIEAQTFYQRQASTVAGAETCLAAPAFALATQTPDQALVQNQFHGTGHSRVVRAHD